MSQNLAYSSGASLAFFVELGQYPPRQLLANSRRHRVGLQHLAADVERQVLAVDDAAQKPQIGRQKTRPLVGDKHPPDIKLDPALALRIEQIERFGRRHEQQVRVFENTLRLVVQGQPRIVEAVADVVVELLVLLGGDFRSRTGPQRRGGVDRLFLAAVLQDDRQSDMVRIGLDDPAQPRRVEILVLALAQMHDDLGAACGVGTAARS